MKRSGVQGKKAKNDSPKDLAKSLPVPRGSTQTIGFTSRFILSIADSTQPG